MPSVFAGRYTAEVHESFVVFLIGMRFNKILAVRKWWPVFTAMPKMLAVLENHKDRGYLGNETFYRVFPVTLCMLSYWRSFEDLERFAHSKDDPHLEAWREFNRKIGSDGSVGIWHETYVIAPGQFEAVYGNMPRFGLAKAMGHVPATGNREAARSRLTVEAEAKPLSAGD